MGLRSKLAYMLSFFMIVIAILAGGSIIIFDKMSGNMKALYTVGEENKLFNELDRNVVDLMDAAKSWGLTGDTRFRRTYNRRADNIGDKFADLFRIFKGNKDIEDLEKDYQKLLFHTKNIMGSRQSVWAPDVRENIHKMETEGIGLITKIDGLQERSVEKVLQVINQSKDIERKMIVYHISLIIFSVLVSIYLILFIKRAITSPFNELLKATEKIGSGEFSHRIKIDRADEFGKISAGFNTMASELEGSDRKISQRLSETELLLDVARIAGTTLDMKDAFTLIAETISQKLMHDSCMIYPSRPDPGLLHLNASRINHLNPGNLDFLPGNYTGRPILPPLNPVVIEDTTINK